MNKTVKVVWSCLTVLIAVGVLFIIYWYPHWYHLHTDDLSVTKETNNEIQEHDVIVTVKGNKNISGEDVGRDINATTVNLNVHRVAIQEDSECYLEPSELTTKRKEFCSKYEGYSDLCSCNNSYNLPKHQLLSNNRVADVPVIIIASNRPMYLYRTLKTLLTIPGANTSLTTVFVDGLFQEPIDVAKILGVNAINHEPSGRGGTARTTQNYKASLTKAFDIYPNAKYVIILEEDLEVAPDFFSYFSQTVDLLEKDPSIYCISAWNDQGYNQSCHDPSMLYRIETMPGLGWLLSRKLYKDELEFKWPRPEKVVNWDNWMRQPYIRKGRECIIPDVSRTYHFGKSGLHIQPSFQEAFFTYHSVNTVKDVQLKNVDKMTKEKYEKHIGDLLRSAEVLDHSKNPCASNYGFIPDTNGKVYVMYITMLSHDDYVTWMELAKCYRLWTNHPRGYHKGLWRLWLKQNQILVVGVPYSPYKTFKPNDVKSLTLKKTAIKDPALKQ